MEQFFKVIWPLLCSLKKTNFSQFVIGSLPVPEQFCGLRSHGLHEFMLWFPMVDQAFGAWTTSFCMTEHKLHFGVGWALLYKKWLQASDFLWFLTSLNCMCVIKNVLKVASKGKQNISWKVVANWKGTNRFCKESQLVYELTHNNL